MIFFDEKSVWSLESELCEYGTTKGKIYITVPKNESGKEENQIDVVVDPL